MIRFHRPGRSPDELRYVAEVLANGHAGSGGPYTEAVSAHLGELLGGAAVLPTGAGTQALELAALLLDVGPGDEVVLPAFTFPSTANAFALRGARLRFADIDPGTFSMGAAEVRAALTPRTRVVVVVHYGGVTADVGEIAALCAERDVDLVEDCAHGLFASFAGRPLGTFGRLAALSFHATKNVSCGEGGALVVNDRALLARAEVLRDKGTDRRRFLRGEVVRYRWQALGSSYAPSDLLAAVLLAQLQAAPAWQAHRHELWDLYRARLSPLGVQLQTIPSALAHPAHLFALLVPPGVDRDGFLAALRTAGVEATSHYEPLHRAPAAPLPVPELPVTEEVAARLVRLPLHVQMEAADASYVADQVEGLLVAAQLGI